MDFKIKLCPFCGNSAHLDRAYDNDGFGFYRFIGCSACNAKSREVFVTKGNDCPDLIAEVKKDWNKRSPLLFVGDDPLCNCPFCGGKAEYVERNNSDFVDGASVLTIYCRDCKASVDTGCWSDAQKEEAKLSLTLRWNNREN